MKQNCKERKKMSFKDIVVITIGPSLNFFVYLQDSSSNLNKNHDGWKIPRI